MIENGNSFECSMVRNKLKYNVIYLIGTILIVVSENRNFIK